MTIKFEYIRCPGKPLVDNITLDYLKIRHAAHVRILDRTSNNKTIYKIYDERNKQLLETFEENNVIVKEIEPEEKPVDNKTNVN